VIVLRIPTQGACRRAEAKPAGAMQLHRTVGPAAAKSPEQAAFYRAFTRQPLEVTFSPALLHSSPGRAHERCQAFFNAWIH
jgi:hypothetical protein